MNKALTVAGAVLPLVFLAACGGGGPAVDPDTPEGAAVQYRQAVMHVAANKLETINEMYAGEVALDEAVFTKTTADLAAAAGMVIEGFEIGESALPGSRALPEIWSNWDDFAQKANDSAEAFASLAAATAEGGYAAGEGLVEGARGTCGACHRTYRERTE